MGFQCGFAAGHQCSGCAAVYLGEWVLNAASIHRLRRCTPWGRGFPMRLRRSTFIQRLRRYTLWGRGFPMRLRRMTSIERLRRFTPWGSGFLMRLRRRHPHRAAAPRDTLGLWALNPASPQTYQHSGCAAGALWGVGTQCGFAAPHCWAHGLSMRLRRSTSTPRLAPPDLLEVVGSITIGDLGLLLHHDRVVRYARSAYH